MGNCLCQYGSSYIGIAPAQDPQLVVAVNVQDPTRQGYYGDEIAGPVFYKVMPFALSDPQDPADKRRAAAHRAHGALIGGNLCPCQPICARNGCPCARSPGSRCSSG